MSEALKNFLVDLATDPDRMKRFTDDPGSELDRAGLSDEEKSAVTSRDATRLRSALGKGHSDTMTQFNARAKQRKAPKKTSRKSTAKKPKPARKGSKKKRK
jgi:aromatic-ring opening dioxygenase LigAB LigA subunit